MRLRKELPVEYYNESIEYEVERERYRVQYAPDDGDLGDTLVDKLTLTEKSLFLKFEQHQEVII